MKKQKRQKSKRNVTKISEMIIRMAADYIDLGEDLSDKQSHLNGACTAWNIAVLPEEERPLALRKFLENYVAINPGVDDVDGLRDDMELLIQKKLELFPDVKLIVFSANIREVDGKRSITVAAASPHLFKK